MMVKICKTLGKLIKSSKSLILIKIWMNSNSLNLLIIINNFKTKIIFHYWAN